MPWHKGKKGIHLSPRTEFKKGHRPPPFSEEHRCKIGEAIKKYRAHPEVKRFYSELMQGENNPSKRPEIKAKIRITRLKQVFPVKDTSIEVALQEELDRHGLVYQKHLPVCGLCQPDIVFPELKIAVFADGDYWHTKDERAIKKDQYQTNVLTEAGWIVLRFWGSEIRNNLHYCVNEIEKALNKRVETE